MRDSVRDRGRTAVVACQVLDVPAQLVVSDARISESSAIAEGQKLPDGRLASLVGAWTVGVALTSGCIRREVLGERL